MCLIIIRPPNQKVNRRELKQALLMNSDGAGFMFNNPDGGVTVVKGWFGFRKYYKTFRHYERIYPDSTFVLHMRIGTSGKRDAVNCHPFQIAVDAGFAHNGIMSGLGDKDRSDTLEFVEDTLRKLPARFWDIEEINATLTECAEVSGSKYVLLLGDGSFFIFNENTGHWKEGCWYSNRSYVVTRNYDKVTRSCGRAAMIKPFDSDNLRSYNQAATASRGRLCTLCLSKADDDEWNFVSGTLIICSRCLKLHVNNNSIRCPACHTDTIITPKLLSSINYGETLCEFCSCEISAEDVVWQLMAHRVLTGV